MSREGKPDSEPKPKCIYCGEERPNPIPADYVAVCFAESNDTEPNPISGRKFHRYESENLTSQSLRAELERVKADRAEKCAEEIMQTYWQDTRTMDYWQEREREAAIIRSHYPDDRELLDKQKHSDNCQICKGRRGGVRGNENIVDGVVVCDYCSCTISEFERLRTAIERRG